MSGSKKNLVSEYNTSERKQMVDPSYEGIPVSVQAGLLGINRTSLYYRPKEYKEEDLKIKADIDRIYTAHPEFGYRRITVWLNKYENYSINHKAVLRHMRQMGIQAVYPRPNTSKPNPANKIYPYLLTGLAINRPDHVWSIDITYIPIRRSFLYLVAIIDWHSRYIVSWMLDDTLDIGFVLEAGRNALQASCPEIMNSDQGSHFTSPKFTGIFLEAGARISMDHRGRAHDNIFIERLWRTVKYENVYLMGYETPRDARSGIGEYLRYYNRQRPHQSLKYRTPEEVYYSAGR
jgi:putative transposase